jgi:hypothetical protein
MKILSVIDGLFFALEGIVPTITTALTTISAGGSMSIPSIILPPAMTNLGIPLTTGSAAMGFTIGFMKG